MHTEVGQAAGLTALALAALLDETVATLGQHLLPSLSQAARRLRHSPRPVPANRPEALQAVVVSHPSWSQHVQD